MHYVSAPQELCKLTQGSCMGINTCRLQAFDAAPRKYQAKFHCHRTPNSGCFFFIRKSFQAFNLALDLPRWESSFQISQLAHEVDTY